MMGSHGRPKIRITSIALWIMLYDLPEAMMKEIFAKQIGCQLGKYIKINTRFPSYMRVRVEYPLHMALVPELKVKIKGRGLMLVVVQYKNVPLFCFTWGRMGHAVANCEQGEAEEHAIKYGGELRASPPRWVREITLRQPDSKVAKTLFQTTMLSASGIGGNRHRQWRSAGQEVKERVVDNSGQGQEGLDQWGEHSSGNSGQHVNVEAKSNTENKNMQVRQEAGGANIPGQNCGITEMVSVTSHP
jgi:hypothetical protein